MPDFENHNLNQTETGPDLKNQNPSWNKNRPTLVSTHTRFSIALKHNTALEGPSIALVHRRGYVPCTLPM